MTGARVLTVAAGHLGDSDDSAGRLVVRTLLADGVHVASRQVVDETEASLDAALHPALEAGGLVVVLAPPGGSSGDIVRRTVARLSGTRLILNERLLVLMEEDFARRGRAMPRRLDRLALLPQSAQLWPAAAGEPGWMLEVRQGVMAVLPLGSPHLAGLVEGFLCPLARERFGGTELTLLRTLRTTGLAPAEAEERLGAWLGKEGEVTVSCLLVDGDVWVRLMARGASRALAEASLAPVESAVIPALGEDCYARDEDALEAVVGRLLVDRGLTVAVAESCTGGLVGHRLTNVPGSSRYFERGVMVYSNRAKVELLGVPEALLRAHGAVSGPVVEAMVTGICRVAGSACGIAVTGIAGPDGGSEAKPVGTVFIGAVSPSGLEVKRYRFPGGRDTVKWRSAQAALDLLRRGLLRTAAAPA
jgi:nicotinamide-nucleotide amidase